MGLLGREVEDIEHHLRPETLAILSKLVSFWREHPDHLNAFKRYARKPPHLLTSP